MNGFNLIVGHLIGDYLFQNDWQAQGKKRSSAICLIHCVLYTLAVWGASRFELSATGAAVVLAIHFAIDRWNFVSWYMGRNGQEAFRDKMGPWSLIVVDNTWHLVVLWFVYNATQVWEIL
jgi:hypothetical protein